MINLYYIFREKSNEPHNVIEPVICIGDFDNSYENTLLALTAQGDNNNADKLANLFSFDVSYILLIF